LHLPVLELRPVGPPFLRCSNSFPSREVVLRGFALFA